MNFVEGFATVAAMVIGISQWIKTKLRWSGAWAEALSFVIGACFGAAARLAWSGAPPDAAGWLAVALSAVAMALVPSGLYKFANQVAATASNGAIVTDKIAISADDFKKLADAGIVSITDSGKA